MVTLPLTPQQIALLKPIVTAELKKPLRCHGCTTLEWRRDGMRATKILKIINSNK